MARKSSKRGIAAGLALACLLGPILAHAHLWLVQHARCAEHGELLHVAGPAGAAAADPAPERDGTHPAPGGAPAADAQSSALSESHEHDHCVIASARKTQTPAGTDGPSVSPPSDDRPRPIHLEAAPPPALARYVLAPKNSPPA